MEAQVFLRCPGIGNASGGEDHGDQRGIAALKKGIDALLLRLRYIPNSVFQSDTHPNNDFSLYYSKMPPDAQ